MADLAALSAELAAVQESLQRAQKDRIEAERVLEAEKARVHQLQADSEGDRARLAALGSQLDAATDTLKSVLVKGCTAFLLEKQPNISVYTLHLSYCCRGCGALPWSPAVTVREKRRVEISCRVDVDGFPGCLDCGRREVSLQLQLATEVEAGKFTASAGPECVLIRMPFFYPGSIKSCHTGGSFMASEELTSLSTLTHGVHCKYGASSARAFVSSLSAWVT